MVRLLSVLIFLCPCLIWAETAATQKPLSQSYLAYIFSEIPKGQEEAQALKQAYFAEAQTPEELARLFLENEIPQLATLKDYVHKNLEGAEYFRKLVENHRENTYFSEAEKTYLRVLAGKFKPSELFAAPKMSAMAISNEPIREEYIKAVKNIRAQSADRFEPGRAYFATTRLLNAEGVEYLPSGRSAKDWSLEISTHGKHPLNIFAHRWYQLFKIHLIFSPYELLRSDASGIFQFDKKALYLSTQTFLDLRHDDVIFHELLHAYFGDANTKDFNSPFRGSLSSSNLLAPGWAYGDFLSFQELATYPLSLRMLSFLYAKAFADDAQSQETARYLATLRYTLDVTDLVALQLHLTLQRMASELDSSAGIKTLRETIAPSLNGSLVTIRRQEEVVTLTKSFEGISQGPLIFPSFDKQKDRLTLTSTTREKLIWQSRSNAILLSLRQTKDLAGNLSAACTLFRQQLDDGLKNPDQVLDWTKKIRALTLSEETEYRKVKLRSVFDLAEKNYREDVAQADPYFRELKPIEREILISLHQNLRVMPKLSTITSFLQNPERRDPTTKSIVLSHLPSFIKRYFSFSIFESRERESLFVFFQTLFSLAPSDRDKAQIRLLAQRPEINFSKMMMGYFEYRSGIFWPRSFDLREVLVEMKTLYTQLGRKSDVEAFLRNIFSRDLLTEARRRTLHHYSVGLTTKEKAMVQYLNESAEGIAKLRKLQKEFPEAFSMVCTSYLESISRTPLN